MPGEPGYDNQGLALSYPVAVLFQKGDEAELASPMGLPSWSSKSFPCRGCCVDAEGLSDFQHCSSEGLEWEALTDDDFELATQRCEHVAYLDRVAHKELEKALFTDKRPDGSRGSALAEDSPMLGLKKHDRLKPSMEVPDVYAFNRLNSYPRKNSLLAPQRGDTGTP